MNIDLNASRLRNMRLFIGLICTALLLSSCVGKDTVKDQSSASYPFMNSALDMDTRVADLVGRMTLEEKSEQMMNGAPAISRLGVPAYNWWSEGLHGVARAGLATVFPQAIGLAASWDEAMMFEVADAISDEARAKHHAFVARDKRFLYQGLTIWSPNINIFRDPRWGRGQETYGEDPFLTGKLAVQFIQGLQGKDDTYLKTIATVKHFAVHNGPEPERHVFDVDVPEKDLVETYLPQFEMGLKEGGAYSLMCAYNRFRGEAACASKELLQKILRDKWKFKGFVVSDCGAILDIHENHKITKTPEESAALAVKRGTELNCGKQYFALVNAVKQGLISEAEIDIAVSRLFMARFKMGMFDPAEKVSYQNIPYSVVDSPKHQQLALDAARKSMVLLKNAATKNGVKILPLSKKLTNIAVIGPNSNQWLMLLGNYNGVPSAPITPLQGIKNAVASGTKVTFAQGSELADGLPMYYPVPASALHTAKNLPGLTAEFFDGDSVNAKLLYSEIMPNLDVNWNDKAPRADMDDDNFTVRWSGTITPELTGNYQIGVITTCNTNLYLDGKLVASTPYHFRNEYGDPRLRKSDPIKLIAGKQYKIEVTATESYADAQVQLVWAQPKPNLKAEALAIAKDADAIIMVMGLTARMEGEEMDIQVDGFRGGDRTKIALPKVQRDLIKDIEALGKPVVLVLLNGSALAINWANEHVDAIIEGWYPGQAGGQAIADVIFGDYNPAGRLPITFYKSVDDLPDFTDYNMTSQTYRFFKNEPLYPFGYGLSYSEFTYSKLYVPNNANMLKPVTVSVTVTNTGEMAGEEVVQVYLANKHIPALKRELPQVIRQLVGFKRIMLKQGESKQLKFVIPTSSFSQVLDNGDKRFLPGTFELSVGGGQPNMQIESTSNVLHKIISFGNDKRVSQQ